MVAAVFGLGTLPIEGVMEGTQQPLEARGESCIATTGSLPPAGFPTRRHIPSNVYDNRPALIALG